LTLNTECSSTNDVHLGLIPHAGCVNTSTVYLSLSYSALGGDMQGVEWHELDCPGPSFCIGMHGTLDIVDKQAIATCWGGRLQMLFQVPWPLTLLLWKG
jgi:hypothetical protein